MTKKISQKNYVKNPHRQQMTDYCKKIVNFLFLLQITLIFHTAKRN